MAHNDDNRIIFSALPAINEEHSAVPGSELIKMSRGFMIVMILAFLFGLLSTVQENIYHDDQENAGVSLAKKTLKSMTLILSKNSAISALLITAFI